MACWQGQDTSLTSHTIGNNVVDCSRTVPRCTACFSYIKGIALHLNQCVVSTCCFSDIQCGVLEVNVLCNNTQHFKCRGYETTLKFSPSQWQLIIGILRNSYFPNWDCSARSVNCAYKCDISWECYWNSEVTARFKVCYTWRSWRKKNNENHWNLIIGSFIESPELYTET